MNFAEWIEKEKGISHKSSHDAVSRLKRAMTILGTEDVSVNDLSRLEEKEAFKLLSMTVKSQLRRTIRLYTEYKSIL